MAVEEEVDVEALERPVHVCLHLHHHVQLGWLAPHATTTIHDAASKHRSNVEPQLPKSHHSSSTNYYSAAAGQRSAAACLLASGARWRTAIGGPRWDPWNILAAWGNVPLEGLGLDRTWV